MKHMAAFVLITFLFIRFFLPEITLFLFFRLFMMPELIGEFIFFSPAAEKEFRWFAFRWQNSISAAITYGNGPLNLG